MANRRRGRPKGPAHKFAHQTIYAAFEALWEHAPGTRTLTRIARMTGEALYAPPTAGPHSRWIEVEFELASGTGPISTKILASGEAMVRASVEQASGPIVRWRSSPCAPPELPKHEMIGNSAPAIATQARRLMKAYLKR